MKHTPLTLLTVISLALVGCGTTQANDEPQTAEESQQLYKDMLESGEAQGPPPMPAGEYAISGLDGAHTTFNLPTDPDHEDLTAIEQYRQEAGIDPVTYAVLDVDNRSGHESITMLKLNAYDADGKKYEFTKLESQFSDWGPGRSYEAEDETYWLPDQTPITEDEYRQLEKAHQDISDTLANHVSQAERNNLILVHNGDDLPTEFTRVSVLPRGMAESEEAYPADWNN